MSHPITQLLDAIFAGADPQWTVLSRAERDAWISPASEEALAELESTLGLALPAALADALRVADGLGIDLALPHATWQILSASRIAEEWSTMNEVAGDLDEGQWDRAWVPVATIGNGELLCIDTREGDRLIRVMRDPEACGVEAASYDGWLAAIAAAARAGEFLLVGRTLFHRSHFTGPRITCPACGATGGRAESCGSCGSPLPLL